MHQSNPTTLDYAPDARYAKAARPTTLALILLLHGITILTMVVFYLTEPLETPRTIQTAGTFQRLAYDWDDKLYIAYASVCLAPLALYALWHQRRSCLWLVIFISYSILALDCAAQIYLINSPPMNIISLGAVTGQIHYSADSFDFLRAPFFVFPGLLLRLHLFWMNMKSRRSQLR